MRKFFQRLTCTTLVAITMSCQSVEKIAGQGKFDRLVWFDPQAKEVLRFHKGYVQLTTWDTTNQKKQVKEQYFPYTYDSSLHVISYNDKTISLEKYGENEWRLEKYEPNDLNLKTAPEQINAVVQPEELRDQVAVEGKVTSTRENDPLQARVLFKSMPNQEHAVEFQTDSSGHFSVNLHRKSYQVTADAEGYLSEGQYVDLTQAPKPLDNAPLYRFSMKPLRMVPMEKGAILSLGITFPFRSADLQPSALPEVARLAQTLKAYPTLVVQVRGHTDNTGTPAHNLELSTRRANVVRDYLIQQGIAPARVLAKGYGQTKPLASNDEEEEGRALNRRADIKIISF